jgi:hypothetical protein
MIWKNKASSGRNGLWLLPWYMTPETEKNKEKS